MIVLLASILLSLPVTGLRQRAATGADIRHVDFKNFSFPWRDTMEEPPSYDASPWHWLTLLPRTKIRFQKGIHHFYEPNQSQMERERAPLASIDKVTYGDLDGDGTEDAAVHLNYSSGGTQNWDYLYVYRILRGQPELMGILESGERGYGGLYRTEIQKGLLVLDFADADRRVGDCCSEGYIRVRYRWQNGTFIEQGPRERGDLKLDEH